MNTIVYWCKTTILYLALRLFSSVLLSQDSFIAFISWAAKRAVALSRSLIKSVRLHVSVFLHHLFVKGVFHHFQVHFVELNSFSIIFGSFMILTVSHGVSHRADWYTIFTFFDGAEVLKFHCMLLILLFLDQIRFVAHFVL